MVALGVAEPLLADAVRDAAALEDLEHLGDGDGAGHVDAADLDGEAVAEEVAGAELVGVEVGPHWRHALPC